MARDALRELLGGREPVVTALHAGLECGVIGDKAPGMDMVRFAGSSDVTRAVRYCYQTVRWFDLRVDLLLYTRQHDSCCTVRSIFAEFRCVYRRHDTTDLVLRRYIIFLESIGVTLLRIFANVLVFLLPPCIFFKL